MACETRRPLVAGLLLVGALMVLVGAAAGAGIRAPAVITVPGTYVLEQNLSVANGTVAIEVRSPNVVIDGNGRTIAGTDAANSCGVLVHAPAGRVRNVTVKNLDFRDLQFGCYLWNTENTSVEDCRIRSCMFGVTLYPAFRASLCGNLLEENDYGFAISGGSGDPEVRSNRVTGSARTGIYLYRARGGLFADNYLSNWRNVYVGDQATGINWTDGPHPGRSVASGSVLGGNFWGRPNGRGFSQTMPDEDGDGVCDRPYRVSGYMVDTLPLCAPANSTRPVAAFTATPASGMAPLTVEFADLSRGSVGTWEWSFGDGAGSGERNASHRYTEPGRYNVTLTVLDPGGANASVRRGTVTVAAPLIAPTAAFRASPRVGDAPLAVQFTDRSAGAPRAWRWTFGDGTNSTERSPLHVYHRAGSYTVSLKVSNAAGNSTRTKTRLVIVTDPEEEKGY